MFDFSEGDSRYSHMPFAAFDGDGNPQEFCCLDVGGLWKLHWRRGRKWRRIQTGLPEDATECGPTAEVLSNPSSEEGRAFLSYWAV